MLFIRAKLQALHEFCFKQIISNDKKPKTTLELPGTMMGCFSPLSAAILWQNSGTE